MWGGGRGVVRVEVDTHLELDRIADTVSGKEKKYINKNSHAVSTRWSHSQSVENVQTRKSNTVESESAVENLSRHVPHDQLTTGVVKTAA